MKLTGPSEQVLGGVAIVDDFDEVSGNERLVIGFIQWRRLEKGDGITVTGRKLLAVLFALDTT